MLREEQTGLRPKLAEKLAGETGLTWTGFPCLTRATLLFGLRYLRTVGY